MLMTISSTCASDHWKELTMEQKQHEPKLLLSRTTLQHEKVHLRRRLQLTNDVSL